MLKLRVEEPTVLLVYVHLGDNPAQTLVYNAQINSRVMAGSLSVLITNRPQMFPDFPGTVLEMTDDHHFLGLRRWMKWNRAFNRVAGGYWRFTLERIFALGEIKRLGYFNVPIIHLESDVILLIDEEILALTIKRLKKTGIPRYSEQDGIASILISHCYERLQSDLVALDNLLRRDVLVENDMVLLGQGLRLGILDELPSKPEVGLAINLGKGSNGHVVVFDGAAYGQYLFGRDPLHSSNRPISGFINPAFGLNPSEFQWGLVQTKLGIVPFFNVGDVQVRLANLHVHAKIEVDPYNDVAWTRFIAEANREVQRNPGSYVPDQIHARKSKLVDRFWIRVVRIIRHLVSWGFR